MKTSTIAKLACPLAVLLVAACGGLLDATIGGTVNGLSGGTTVGLTDNGIDPISVNANGNFTFDAQIQAGSTYNVAVTSQPIGETCTVTNGTGTVKQNSGDVTNVRVSCLANVTAGNDIFGTVSGLASGKSVTLLDTNNADTVTVSANGSFVFPTALAAGFAYSVTVSVNPSGQTCSVSNASGVVAGSGTIAPVVVVCN
jgi:hypothetical protein